MTYAQFCESNEYVDDLVTALENYDSTDSAFTTLKHLFNICCAYIYVDNDPDKGFDDNNELLGEMCSGFLEDYDALCGDNPETALETLGYEDEEIEDLMNLLHPHDVEVFLEGVIRGFAFNTDRGGLEYKISGDYVGYAEANWSGYSFRPVEIHYDQSIAEEVADVFEDLGESGITLTQIIDTPETGIVLDIILPSVIILLTLITTVCVWKKKEQY